MSNPYDHSFPQRTETMFLNTIQSSQPRASHLRQSSFLRQDIPGATNRQQIPPRVTRQNYAHSAFIESVPCSHVMTNKFIGSNNLNTKDIQYAQPRCSDFRTNRVTNPINPRYQLPYVAPVVPEPARPFIRDTLDISDMAVKKQPHVRTRQQKFNVDGSSPSKLFRTVDAVSRLDVKDINKDGRFISKRTQSPTNPLDPSYTWRDANRYNVNNNYGDIGNHNKRQIPQKVNRRSDLNFSTQDIEGAKANSYNDKRYFPQQRRSVKDSLNNSDIPKAMASSLKKGISTGRQVNPLMPQYPYPSSRY